MGGGGGGEEEKQEVESGEVLKGSTHTLYPLLCIRSAMLIYEHSPLETLNC